MRRPGRRAKDETGVPNPKAKRGAKEKGLKEHKKEIKEALRLASYALPS